MAVKGEKGFFEEWPDWAKPVMALAAMILLGGAWIGVPSLMAWELMQRSLELGNATYEPIITVLVAMTTATIAGVFLFMTFRIDRGTRLKAEKIAKDVVEKEVEEAKKKVETFVVETAPQVVDKKIADLLKEGDLQRHVEAVLMIDANIQIVGEYVKQRAGDLQPKTIDQFIRLMNEIVKGLQAQVREKRRQSRRKFWKEFFGMSDSSSKDDK